MSPQKSQTNKYNQQKTTNGRPQTDLDPLTPEDAIEMYEADRKQELRKTSLAVHQSALRFFKQWCSIREIENLNNLTGRQLHQYRTWRREDAPTKTDTLSKQSEKTQQKILRQFIRYCEQIDAVPVGLHAKVRIPSVPDDDVARSETVDADQAQEIINWLSDYHYASLEHVVWLLLADTGARIGTIVALDLDDYRHQKDSPHIRVRHRPATGTKLKNGENGERLIAVSEDTCKIIDEYVAHQRPEITDEYNREPLLATSHGRVAKGTVRKYVYKWTRPCAIGHGCPHDRDPDSCKAANANSASKCPSSRSPHAIRRGYITHQLEAGVETSFLGGRCDVSNEVLQEHYDARDERAKMEVRRRELDQARRDHSSYAGR